MGLGYYPPPTAVWGSHLGGSSMTSFIIIIKAFERINLFVDKMYNICLLLVYPSTKVYLYLQMQISGCVTSLPKYHGISLSPDAGFRFCY